MARASRKGKSLADRYQLLYRSYDTGNNFNTTHYEDLEEILKLLQPYHYTLFKTNRPLMYDVWRYKDQQGLINIILNLSEEENQ